MKWSWKLGSLAGIKVQVHWTFLILIGWVVFAHAAGGADIGEIAAGVVLVVVVFGCVVLHELGHALTARRFGIPTRDITLLPIGGVARLERMPDDPKQELLVAVAGPAVNVVIAALLLAILVASQTRPVLADVTVVGGSLLAQLMAVNVLLVVFNLLPAFPMDGGRMLRATLALRMPYVRATRIAATAGRTMAILFGFVGLFTNPFLVFIAIFVYLGAQAEAQHTELRYALEGVAVRDAMMTRFTVLSPQDTLGRAADELLAGAQQDFPVRDGLRFVGMLRRSSLVSALRERGRDTPVGDVADAVDGVDEDDGLDQVLERMRRGQSAAVPVFRDAELVGLLTLENVGELLMMGGARGPAVRGLLGGADTGPGR